MQVVILRDCVSGPQNHFHSYESGQHIELPELYAMDLVRAGYAKLERDDEKPKEPAKVERTVRRNRKMERR